MQLWGHIAPCANGQTRSGSHWLVEVTREQAASLSGGYVRTTSWARSCSTSFSGAKNEYLRPLFR